MSAPPRVADQRRWQRSEWHGEEAGPAFPQDPQDDGGGQDDGGHDDADRLEDKRPDQVERLTPHGADRFTKSHEERREVILFRCYQFSSRYHINPQ